MSKTVKKTESKKAKRYTSDEKQKFLNDYQKLRDAGKNADVAAKEIGVPYITLRTWQKATVVQPKGKKRGRPARAAARGSKATKKARSPRKAPGSAAVVLVLPDGTRVECSTPKDAVAFIKASR